MPTVKEHGNRQTLGEGRNWGMGFAFAKRDKEASGVVYNTAHAITACKDYLNDVVYQQIVDTVNKPIYGFSYKKTPGLYGRKYAYMVIKMLDYSNGGAYEKKDHYQKILIDNYKLLEGFINYIEDYLKLDANTKVLLDDSKEHIILKLPKYFVQETYLTSMYTGLVRASLTWLEKHHEDYNPIDFLKSGKVMPCEINIVKNCVKALPVLREVGDNYWKTNYNKNTSISTVHNSGIVGHNSKICAAK